MLRRYLLTVLLFSLAAAISAAALPQDNGNTNQQAAPPSGPEQHQGRGHFDPARRTQMLTKQLNLTSDQQSKVQDILKSEQSQMESLHSDTSTSPEDRRSKMMDIRKASNDQIRGILTADQQKKWDEMESRREQWQGHHGAEKPSTPSGSSSPQN